MSLSLLSRRHVRAVLVLAALGTAVVACDPDRASLVAPYGPVALNFNLSAQAAGDAKLPGGTVGAFRPATGSDSVRISLRYLEPLTGGVYQVWLGRDTAGALTNVVPATGTVRVITAKTGGRDTVTTANASTFNGRADTTARYLITVSPANLAADPAINVAFVTIEPAAATAPGASSPRPLWAKFTRPASGGSATANFVFGNYSADPTKLYAFPLTGRGKAAVRLNQLFVDDSAKGRPPVGYYWAAYAIGVDTATATSNDTISLGEFTAPFPRQKTSLKDADMSTPDPVVTDRPYSISAAALEYTGPADFRFKFYPTLVIGLKNKLADPAVLPPNRVLVGNLPASIVTP